MLQSIYNRLGTYTVLGHNLRLIHLALKVQLCLVRFNLAKQWKED